MDVVVVDVAPLDVYERVCEIKQKCVVLEFSAVDSG